MKCNLCRTEMDDLVLSYFHETPFGSAIDEVKITANGEPGAPKYWFYICPHCGNVQAKKVEDNNDYDA